MTHKLIHTPNYLLVVDDSEIKEGGFVLVSCSELDIIETRKVKDYYNEQFLFDGGGQIHMDYCKKIIAHLPLNDSPILEGVDLLPPFEQEDDVDELAKEYGEDIGNKDGTSAFDYKRGYNKAKEKYKYTEKDVNIMVNNAVVFAESNTHLSVGEYATQFKDFYDKCIQSLSQTKMPVVFECEEKVSSDSMYVNHVIYETKTITTSKGNTQWVGKYIHQ